MNFDELRLITSIIININYLLINIIDDEIFNIFDRKNKNIKHFHIFDINRDYDVININYI